MSEFVIYMITNVVNGKKYVGQTITCKRRWIAHRYELNGNRHHNYKLQNAWNKYGSSNFLFEVIDATAQSLEELDLLEMQYIATFDSWKSGYNLTEGADTRNSQSIPVTWNRVTYPSYAAAEQAAGYDTGVFRYWLEKGAACDADVTPSARPCIWEGVRYSSRADAAKAARVTPSTLGRWLREGKTCAPNLDSKYPVPCEWNRVKYPSYAAAAKAAGVSKQTIRTHILKGRKGDADIPRLGRRKICE
jgi:hypothetical protein